MDVYNLTERQREILAFIICGYNNRIIGQIMGISRETVCHQISGIKGNLSGIFDRMDLGVRKRVIAAKKALESGYMSEKTAKEIVGRYL